MKNANITTITYNMIVDELKPGTILHEPSNRQRAFSWIASPRWEKGLVPEKNVAIVCKHDAIEYAAKIAPDAFFVVLNEGSLKDPLEPLLEESLIVQYRGNENLLQRLQNLFLKINCWKTEISSMSGLNNCIKEMLNQSSDLLGAPLLLYSEEGHLVERSFQQETNSLLTKKCTDSERALIEQVLPCEDNPIELSLDGSICFACHASFCVGKRHRFHLVTSHEKKPPRGTADILSQLAFEIANNMISGEITPDIEDRSIHTLFDSLINRKYVSKSTLEEYSSLYNFAGDEEFRLLRFAHNGRSTSLDSSFVSEHIVRLNNGRCLVTTYENCTLALLHSNDRDNSLSNPAIEEGLAGIPKSYEGYVAVSQVFNHISNLSHAYDQTDLVIKYHDYIDLNRIFSGGARKGRKLCYSFEEALLFALVEPNAMSQEMRDFAFSHTILEKIISEDAHTGSEDARILATYLYHERKATVVAEKLHMHRNTVLYRISKIEKRFDLDLSKGWSRDRIILDFAVFYCRLMRDAELRNKLLGENSLFPEDNSV